MGTSDASINVDCEVNCPFALGLPCTSAVSVNCFKTAQTKQMPKSKQTAALLSIRGHVEGGTLERKDSKTSGRTITSKNSSLPLHVPHGSDRGTCKFTFAHSQNISRFLLKGNNGSRVGLWNTHQDTLNGTAAQTHSNNSPHTRRITRRRL